MIGPVILAIALLWPHYASAQKTGNEFVEICRHVETMLLEGPGTLAADAPTAGRCLGYLTGFSDGVALGSSARGGTITKPFCIPSQATYGQQALVALKWLRAHPTMLHESTPLVVGLAFRDAFPCPAR